MRLVVADASSLILLAKISLLEAFGRRVSLLAPRRVLAEASAKRLWPAHPDAAEIARCAQEGLIQGVAVKSRRKLPLALGGGEAAAIRLVLERRADLLLSDDGRALRACRLLGIAFTTSPRVIVDLCLRRAISQERARRALEQLAVVGRYSRDVIAAALAALQESHHDEADDDSSA